MQSILKRSALIMMPVILQNMIVFLLGMIDSVMLSAYSQSAFAAWSLASQPWNIFYVIMFGLSTGTCILTSQYYGKRDNVSTGSVMVIGLSFSLSAGVIFALILFFAPDFVLRLFTDDHNLIALGSKYLRIISPSYIFTSISLLYASYLRSVEKAAAPLIFNGISIILNTALNYVFIFGVLCIKPYGIEGAATATLIARAVELIIMLYYFKYAEKFISLKIDFAKVKILIPDFLKFAAPVLLNEALWGVGAAVHSAIFGRMGETAITAFGVIGTVEKVALVVCMGITQSAGVILGIELGQGNTEKADKYSSKFLRASVISGLICGALLFAATPLVISAFKLNNETAALYKQFAAVCAIFLAFKFYTVVGVCSVLRAGADSTAALIIDIAIMWLITNPFGWIFALSIGGSPTYVYIILISEVLLKAPIMLFRIKRRKWLNNITRS